MPLYKVTFTFMSNLFTSIEKLNENNSNMYKGKGKMNKNNKITLFFLNNTVL